MKDTFLRLKTRTLQITMCGAAFFASTLTNAQMPVSLIDNQVSIDPQHWVEAEETIRSGLECRDLIDPNDPGLQNLLSAADSPQWTLVPPRNFSIFGLQVQSVTLFIDPDGEMGASYTATVAAPMALSKHSIDATEQSAKIGGIMIEERSPSLTEITCTVDGTRESD